MRLLPLPFLCEGYGRKGFRRGLQNLHWLESRETFGSAPDKVCVNTPEGIV